MSAEGAWPKEVKGRSKAATKLFRSFVDGYVVIICIFFSFHVRRWKATELTMKGERVEVAPLLLTDILRGTYRCTYADGRCNGRFGRENMADPRNPGRNCFIASLSIWDGQLNSAIIIGVPSPCGEVSIFL